MCVCLCKCVCERVCLRVQMHALVGVWRGQRGVSVTLLNRSLLYSFEAGSLIELGTHVFQGRLAASKPQCYRGPPESQASS